MSLARELSVNFLRVTKSAFIAKLEVNTLSVTGAVVLPVVTTNTITTKTLILKNAASTDQAVLSVVTDTLNIDSPNINLNGNVNITGNLVTSNGITQVVIIIDKDGLQHIMTFVSGILTDYSAV